MSSAGQRRITFWLLSATGLLAALTLALASGLGRDIEWLPPQETELGSVPADGDAIAPPSPLDAFANTWTQPLFSPDRRPDPPQQAAETQLLQGFTLTGVMLTESLRIALLRDSQGKDVSIVEGKTLPNGWTLERVEARKVLFTSGSLQQSLPLHAVEPARNDKPQ